MVLRNVVILSHHNTVSQHEDGGIMVLRNVVILPHHNTVSRNAVKTLNPSSLRFVLFNFKFHFT
jgi:hypothetical protein